MSHFNRRHHYSHDNGLHSFTARTDENYCMVPSAGESSAIIIAYNFGLSTLSLVEVMSYGTFGNDLTL